MKKENVFLLIIAIAMYTACVFALGYMYAESKSDGPNYPEIPDSSIEVYKDSIEVFIYKSMDSLLIENNKLKEAVQTKIKSTKKILHTNENNKNRSLSANDSTAVYILDSLLSGGDKKP